MGAALMGIIMVTMTVIISLTAILNLAKALSKARASIHHQAELEIVLVAVVTEGEF
jgi:heme/copper-type cytochrome/quinol oxidase subunit 2